MNATIEKYLKHIAQIQRPPRAKFPPQEIQAAWFSVGKMLCEVYVFDDVSKVMFPDLFRPDNAKGCCFCGSKGIGKTLNLDIFARLNTDLYRVPTETWEVTEIEIQYKASGASFLDRLGNLPCLVINDAGTESKVLNDYGTNRNIIADLLFLRYRAFQVDKKKTHLSTNNKWETVLSHYGSRLADRMNEMFLPVEIKGESRRK